MLDTRDFCRYLRSVRDGELSVPTSWVIRCGIGDEPFSHIVCYELERQMEDLSVDDIVTALVTAALDGTATHVEIKGPIRLTTDPDKIDDLAVQHLNLLRFNPCDSYITFHPSCGDLGLTLGIALFTKDEFYEVESYNEGEIMVSG